MPLSPDIFIYLSILESILTHQFKINTSYCLHYEVLQTTFNALVLHYDQWVKLLPFEFRVNLREVLCLYKHQCSV